VPPPAAPARPEPRTEPAAPQPDRERALRAALAFTDALLRSDATALAAASTATFSFDGEPVAGRDAQVRRWGGIFAERRAGAATLTDLALLGAADALAQLGPPPARIAGLVKAGAWVAVADLSGRPVVLVIVQEGGRFAVAAMHD
jgi:ketosteroid isomerase-like protein